MQVDTTDNTHKIWFSC